MESFGHASFDQFKLFGRSCQFLLDEECAKMGQLPRAGDGQDGQLYQGPSNNLAVGAFTLVAEFGFSFL